MPGYFIARAKRLHKSAVAGAIKHQFRLIPTPNADPARRHLNVDFGPQTPEAMFEAVDARYRAEGIEPDPNRVYLAEVLVSMTHKALDEKTALAMLHDARKQLEKKHGKANVIGGSLQMDEHTPHAAFFIVPIAYRETRTVKKSVIAKGVDENGKRNRVLKDVKVKGGAHQSYKEFFGGSQYNLSDWQTEMHEAIGKKYGLQRGIEGSKAKHTTVQDFYKTMEGGNIKKLDKVDILAKIPVKDFLESNATYRKRLEKYFSKIIDFMNKKVDFLNTKITNSRIQTKKLKEKDATIEALNATGLEHFGEAQRYKNAFSENELLAVEASQQQELAAITAKREAAKTKPTPEAKPTPENQAPTGLRAAVAAATAARAGQTPPAGLETPPAGLETPPAGEDKGGDDYDPMQQFR